MRTETLIKMLSKMAALFNRRVIVRLDGVIYQVSHVENTDDNDIIVICRSPED